MLIVLDTNVFIDATNPNAPEHHGARVLTNGRSGLDVSVSRHSLSELEHRDDQALALARCARLLAYYPVGTISQLLGKVDDLAGSFDDMRTSAEVKEKLDKLLRRNVGIRDKGCVIDAIWAAAEYFVTSDRALSDSKPANLIRSIAGLIIVRPGTLVRELDLEANS